MMPDQPRSNVLLRGPKSSSANSNAIDAAIGVARGRRGCPNGGARDGARPQHNAGPGNAARRIVDVLAVHHRFGWCWSESDTCKAQQDAGRKTR
jgi:hypothetical protein